MIARADEWAADFIKCGADINALNRELSACNVAPDKAEAVRAEFIKQTLAAMEVAKRGRNQWAAQ